MSQSLIVYLHAEKVGVLALEEGRFRFQYDDTWLENSEAIPLSLNLRLQVEPFDDAQTRSFFANLLPEAEIRLAVARSLGLSEKNDFALLRAIGGECAGAVSLIEDDLPPTGEIAYRVLEDEELNGLIEELPRRPMLAGEKGIRLSLAGAQNKLPVHFNHGVISLPLCGATSTHILKLPIHNLPYTVENEYFCMQLATEIGLPVPSTTFLKKAQSLYLVHRYDRKVNAAGELVRVHQEDFCQAMGIPPDQKYEKEGGPSLAQCFRLLRENSIMPVPDMRDLLEWVIFNYLIGNADAHGKNISLLLTEHGPHLAPFYDLMSTAVYPSLTDRLAMKIGGEDRPDWVIERRWHQFSEDIGISYKMVEHRLKTMMHMVSEKADYLAKRFKELHGECEIVGEIVGVIEERGNKLTRILAS